jgi:hypothetical protein
MCANWGIETKTKLPVPIVFTKASTFEQEFSKFLKTIILQKQPMIESDEVKGKVEKLREETERQEAVRRSNIEREIALGKTLLDLLYFQYCRRSALPE